MLRSVAILTRKVCGHHCRTLSSTAVRAKILSHSPNAYLDKSVLQRYRNLKYDTNKVQATYLWIDGTGENLRLKDRVLDAIPRSVADLPQWQYDGSSTYQALGENSDTTLIPRAIYRDPFKASEHDVLVVCDTYKPDGAPTDSNHRYLCQDAVDKTKAEEPWFGIEQEYTLLDIDGRPFGWPANGFPAPQGPYCKSSLISCLVEHLTITWSPSQTAVSERRRCMLATWPRHTRSPVCTLALTSPGPTPR